MSDRLSICDDMSNPLVKRRVMATVGGLQGVHRIEICKYRPRRTDRQNRFYWPCFVKPFSDYLVAEGNECDDPEDAAHEILKALFLRSQKIDPKLGRLPFVRSTTELTTLEFNHYLDDCARLLAEIGIIVPEPNIYHEVDEPKRTRRQRAEQVLS